MSAELFNKIEEWVELYDDDDDDELFANSLILWKLVLLFNELCSLFWVFDFGKIMTK